MQRPMPRRCEGEGCASLSRTFNVEGEARGRFCKVHKREGMVDVKSRRCEAEGLGGEVNPRPSARVRLVDTTAE